MTPQQWNIDVQTVTLLMDAITALVLCCEAGREQQLRQVWL